MVQSQARIVVVATLLERFLKASVFVGVRGATFVGFWLFLYIVVGTLANMGGWFDPTYPFLSPHSDPVFVITVSLVGLFMVQATASILLYHFLIGFEDERSQAAVLMSFIGLGFGGGLLRMVLPTTIGLILSFL
ncbi:hypothetical protein DMJ13_26380 [halophilic archaeon]|nr:hypothetical protein DMJ13_26380 [halophilic archaeon]